MISDVEEALFIGRFGIGSEQFQVELEAEWEQATPEQRAEFKALVDQANAVLPGLHASLGRIDASLSAAQASTSELKASLASLEARLSNMEDRLSPLAGISLS